MKKVTITPKARADLKDISRYTDKKWERKQRLKYIKQLKDRISYLANKQRWGINVTR
jgi:plasmid stabilization system protein ParE